MFTIFRFTSFNLSCDMAANFTILKNSFHSYASKPIFFFFNFLFFKAGLGQNPDGKKVGEENDTSGEVIFEIFLTNHLILTTICN